MEMYAEATTRLTERRKTRRMIKINAGVKQFNLIIDELIEKSKKLSIGIQLGDKLLCCMAFADNLVFLTEERIHMQIMLEEWNEFFDNKGLTANSGKCASLRVVPVPKERTIKVILKDHRKWVDQRIPSITFDELVE